MIMVAAMMMVNMDKDGDDYLKEMLQPIGLKVVLRNTEGLVRL